jgi:pimeloyl-ACP methyl ester carboxylesterase
MPYVERDGRRIEYDRDGSGPELLFVPGWCCDQTFFAPQFEHFKQTHTVTTLDMRWAATAISTLADEVAWFCGEVGIERPVVVGHSLGGMIAIELGARYPLFARGLVADDPGPVHLSELATYIFPGFAAQMAGPAGEDVRRAWVSDVGPTASDDVRRHIIENMCSVPLDTARALIENVATWNGPAALSLCDTPLLIILTAAAGSNEPSRLRAMNPGIRLGMTVGSGHFNQLEVPEQVNAMIDRFLDLL